MVTAQLIAVLASLLKRGWLESTKEERNTFFAELESIVGSSGSKGAARRAWARILAVTCCLCTEWSKVFVSRFTSPRLVLAMR